MSGNKEMIIEKYKDTQEEYRATASRYSGLEFHYTKRHISEYIGLSSSVIELGCGTGYYAMYFSGKCKEYIGIDITPENIALLNKKAQAQGLDNVEGIVGDVEDIPDNCFDVVLCLGPVYHLPPLLISTGSGCMPGLVCMINSVKIIPVKKPMKLY
ncbi:putative methyltransferase YcgJ [Lachnospiraceae bacterium]|nr:putative methyltransferase YcgJ [Lachnospiraceae bacterium]